MTGILDQIHHPEDVKRLDVEELGRLCEEMRKEIISTVSKNGGHLASNLGVVEVTGALHYVFDSGHSGPSISAALGMSEARRQKGEKGRVIAVIGDGSMTAGLAFEGLNQSGHLDRDMIVVLNDNEMSISPNVGALSSYLNRLMTGQFVNRFRDEIKAFLETLPGIGKPALRFAKQAEESLKGLLIPGILFEELGLKYIGPIDGHRLDYLIETFQNIKNMKGPILVHVLTKKGRGYQPAEMDPVRFHGIPPFLIETGEERKDQATHPPTFTDVFGETLCQLAKRKKQLVVITAAMQSGTGLEEFARQFPDRFSDVGIADQHAVTFAAGLALEGMKPVVAI